MNVIETVGLYKYYGVKAAVDDLSLSVGEGEIYGFLGENGAGKSTTIRILLGLIWSDEGEAYLQGKLVEPGNGETHLGVGAMLDEPRFYGHLSAEQNLRLFAQLSGPVSQAQIDRALKLLGLESLRNQSAGTLSHGQKQRLGIALALLPDNKILILDEPQNGLDPLWVKNLREVLRDLSQEGISILISSHRLHEIEQVCHRVGIIHQGKMLYEGSVAPLLSSAEFVSLRCDRLEEATSFLDQTGYQRQVGDNGSFLVHAPTDSDAAHLNRKLLDAGYEVYELSRRRITLEEIFLQLTNPLENSK